MHFMLYSASYICDKSQTSPNRGGRILAQGAATQSRSPGYAYGQVSAEPNRVEYGRRAPRPHQPRVDFGLGKPPFR